MLSYCFCLLDGRECIIIWERKLFLMEALFGLTPEVSLAVIDCLLPQADRKLTSFCSSKLRSRLISGMLELFPWPQWPVVLKLLTVRLFSQSWHVEKGVVLSDMSLHLKHVWWYCPIFPTHVLPLHKCELAGAMPPSTAKLPSGFYTQMKYPSKARFLNSRCWTNIFSDIDCSCAVVTKCHQVCKREKSESTMSE